ADAAHLAQVATGAVAGLGDVHRDVVADLHGPLAPGGILPARLLVALRAADAGGAGASVCRLGVALPAVRRAGLRPVWRVRAPRLRRGRLVLATVVPTEQATGRRAER